MTLKEKFCFLFLLCCVIAKKTPIIQGVTASGKSFIVKLFAELLGQDLSIYQLNSNSGISIFTGQSVIKKNFDEKEIEKLKNILKLLNLTDKKIKKIKHISQKYFFKLQSEIKTKLESNELNQEERLEYEKAKDTLTILKSPLNIFTHQDSELINGIRNGKWIALDGIELANPQISEKMSSLCGEVPILNVFESGLEDLNFNSANINPNFRLFIIYNPTSKDAKKIDQSLFNKCIKFTLNSFDLNPRDASTMLYKSIINIMENPTKFDISLWSNICSRIARYHIEETKKSKNNTDLVAGNVPFTSRNLCFISKDYYYFYNYLKKQKDKNINIETWLQSIFDNYYWRSFVNYSQREKKELKEETLNIIKIIPDYEYKVDHELDFKQAFKEIIEYLIQIQNYVIRNIEYRDFDFEDLLGHCLNVHLNESELQYIYNNLLDTILLLDNDNNINEILKNRFYQIYFIKNNYERLLNYLKNEGGFQDKIELISDHLLKKEGIKIYLLRMRFLNIILKNENTNKIYNPNLNYELFPPFSNELSKILSELIKNKTKDYFEDLIKFLVKNPGAFKIIHYYYPYNNKELKEGQLKFANYYIYYLYSLYGKKINFSIRLGNQRYDIIFPNEDQDKKINPYFVFNEANSLYLSKGSFLKNNLKNPYDNQYKQEIFYLEKNPEENTKNMFNWIRKSFDGLYPEFPLKSLEEIDNFQLEASKFFIGSTSTLMSRIWSLIINLTDKHSDIIEYLKNECCFLEKDALNIFSSYYKKLDKCNLNELVEKMSDLSFFCESSSKSMLWKYRVLLNNLKKEDKNDKYFNYFQLENFEPDDELKVINNEIINLNKLEIIFWPEAEINCYKEKLTDLKKHINAYKNKGIEEPKITKLRSEANDLLILLEKKVKDKTYSEKTLIILKNEIFDFINSAIPVQEILDSLKNKVNIFIDLIMKERQNNPDRLNLPNKDGTNY